MRNIVTEYGEYPASIDGGTWYPPKASRLLKMDNHMHSLNKE
ncbi:MAG TPA: hypothetical protein VN703_00155 [Candidatus Sulfopaludibacter sp.]|jgi:hypothetical protein|nr:hypothetical protein [Candidatus Sulfopaludibacter sp.]